MVLSAAGNIRFADNKDIILSCALIIEFVELSKLLAVPKIFYNCFSYPWNHPIFTMLLRLLYIIKSLNV